jgi:translation initiation factor IF-3
VNEEIRVKEVRLIDETNKQLGIFPVREAIQMAREKGLDLVEVAPNANPPVCKILDFGKYAFEQAKREREQRKNQKTIEVKTLRLRPKTADYHEGFKVKQARGWLADGAKVKVLILFRGRELFVSADSARKQLAEVAEALSDVAVIEQRPDIEGRTMFMMLAPANAKPAKAKA